MPRIAVIPGDGIGPEVMREAIRILTAVSAQRGLGYECVELPLGAKQYLARGVALTEEEFVSLGRDYEAILLGALGDPRVPDHAHARDILMGLRLRLDLYVNFRPCHLLHPELSPLARRSDRAVRLDIFRENTEGEYVDLGGVFKEGTPDEIALQDVVTTAKGVRRIVRAAFSFARNRGIGRVTLVDKANAMPTAGRLWRGIFREVGQEYPEIEREAVFVDAMAMELVRRPERYSVIVTGNLFGDILSDLAAEITGGLGLAPSANLHPGRHALFEPVHGSAPDIAGTGVANPLAAIRCTGLLLDHFGHRAEACAIDRCVEASVTAGCLTPDLGGSATTSEVGDWLLARLESELAA